MENILKAINEMAVNKYSELKNQCSTYGELKEKIREFRTDKAWEPHVTRFEPKVNTLICDKINALFDEEIENIIIKKQ